MDQGDATLPKRRKAGLPPVKRNPAYFKDPYQNSFLMTYDLKKQNNEKLKNIILEHAKNEMEVITDKYCKTKDKELPVPEIPEAVLSNDRQIKMNYHFLKQQITKTPIVPIQSETFDRILAKVEDCFTNTPAMNRVVTQVFDDTKAMYNEAMQKTVIQNVLIAPNVKGLEDEQARIGRNDQEGLDFSCKWENNFHESRELVSKRLHLLHPSHLVLLDLCQHSYGSDPSLRCIGEMLMIDFRKLRLIGSMDQHQLKNNITIELEKSQEFIKNIWYTNFVNIFMDKNQFKTIPTNQLDSFYDSVSVLASNQLKDLLLRTINAWCDLMKPENHLICPVIRMELTFDDNKMQFYPTYNTIRDLFLSVVDKIAQALPSVQSIKGFINAENEIIDTTVSNDSIKKAGERLKESLEFYMIEPRSHLSAYIEKYSFIVDGTAEKRIDAFIADHTKEFDDYTVEIQSFQDIITQIQRELSVVEFDMIFLMCDDLKIALIRITREHMNRLIEVLIRNHRLESHKICEEYEHIKGKALCKPETTEELNEMVKYIEHTKEEGVIKLEARIRELRRHMAYLLDTHLFEKEDIDLNTEVMMWPTNINPIFDQNEELTNETRQAYESLLNHQREKLLIELDKLHKRIDEFSDYGELDQMKQYVDDTKNVAKRINDANRLIE